MDSSDRHRSSHASHVLQLNAGNVRPNLLTMALQSADDSAVTSLRNVAMIPLAE